MIWRQNYSSVSELSDKFIEELNLMASRAHVLHVTEYQVEGWPCWVRSARISPTGS